MDETDNSPNSDNPESIAKSEFAKHRPRDASGHFLPLPDQTDDISDKTVVNHLMNNVSINKTRKDDTLIDVHVGNPLERMTKLLEEIKKQKAFSFTLKGSLGIMGVVLALSTIGVFGGTKMLCQKGTQSLIGTVRILQFQQEPDRIPILSQVKDGFDYLIFRTLPSRPHPRIILVQRDNQTIELATNVALESFRNKEVITSGEYDSCSRILKISNLLSIEQLK
jgi:hypothetical protein